MNLSSSGSGDVWIIWNWVNKVTAAVEQVEQRINIFCRKRKPRPKEDVRVLLENLRRKEWRNQPLVDRHNQQSFIPSG